MQLVIFRLEAPALARISHQLSTAAADPGMSTALRSVGLLDILSSMLAGPSVALAGKLPDAPCIHARLRRLATKSGEKCGLGARASRPPDCATTQMDSYIFRESERLTNAAFGSFAGETPRVPSTPLRGSKPIVKPHPIPPLPARLLRKPLPVELPAIYSPDDRCGAKAFQQAPECEQPLRR
jgi:hypothetical protein